MSRPRSAKTLKNQERPPRAALEHVLAGEVIRYWLATLVFQEALATRPKARRATNATPTVINVEAPMTGQDYAKLPFAGAERFLLERRDEHPIDLTSDWSGFFEHWLAARYRRGDDDNATRQLVCFPTLHLHQGELAGLLRFPVDTEWHSGDHPFVVPTYAQRQRGLWPAAPTRLVLKQTEDEAEHILPFFVDARILHETLRIDSERIDDFFTELRGRKRVQAPTLVRALCDLIEKQNLIEGHATTPSVHDQSVDAQHGGTLLARLVELLSQRLSAVRSRARVYGVALVVCCDQNRTTWHLQRDLQEALAAFELGEVDAKSALHAYFSGLAPGTGAITCWGRWRGAGLTECQRAACELALGSSLAAVQGPPGTGKTTLILNLLAHTLVRKVTALARKGKMGRAITVVASTNNRAVDNVVDPLGRDLEAQSLPLSFRVGSRQVVENVSVAELERVRGWLREQTITELEAKPLLSKELERFLELRAVLEARLGPEQIHQQKLERSRSVEARLAELRSQLDSTRENPWRRLRAALRELAVAPSTASQSPQLTAEFTEGGTSQTTAAANKRRSRSASGASERLDSESAIDAFLRDSSRHAPAAVHLAELAARLEALSDLADRRGSRLAEVKRHWKQTRKRALAGVRIALGFEIFVDQPAPELGAGTVRDVLDAWEEAAESMLSAVREVEQLLLDGLERAKGEALFSTLSAELAVLKEQSSAPPAVSGADRAELEKLQLELFECAVRVREAWALIHRVELLNALERAVRAIQTSRSLRSLVEEEDGVVRWLRELFPAWGCTLLSLGNVFPPEQDSIELLIIDEAGQCHPAYAVAALVRAQSTLIIGDTNQLEPVVGLSRDDEGRIVRGLELKSRLEQLEPFRIFDGSCVSAQSIADRCVSVRPTLVDHFRCQPEIAAICEALCHYGLVTRTSRRTRADLAPFLAGPVLHAPTDGAQERFAGSWMNEVEARVTIQLVRDLLTAGVLPEEIGVVTPYRGQLERLWRELRELRIPLERSPAEMFDSESGGRTGTSDRGLGVGTVHRFQGGERSIILFTTTVTEQGSLKFVDERVNLVNVAVSRARDHLVTIGHSPTLKAGRHTRHLIEHAIRLR